MVIGKLNFDLTTDTVKDIHNDALYNMAFCSEETRAFKLKDLFFFNKGNPINQKYLEERLFDQSIEFEYWKIESEDGHAIGAKIVLGTGIEIIINDEWFYDNDDEVIDGGYTFSSIWRVDEKPDHFAQFKKVQRL